MLKFALSKVIVLIVIRILTVGVLVQDSAAKADAVAASDTNSSLETARIKGGKSTDGSNCKAMALCYMFNDVYNDKIYEPTTCYFDDGTIGACCDIREYEYPTDESDLQPDEKSKQENSTHLSPLDIKIAIENAEKECNDILARRNELSGKLTQSRKTDALAKAHQDFFLVKGSAAPERSRIGCIRSKSAKSLGLKYKLSPSQINSALHLLNGTSNPFIKYCQEERCPQCNYRSADGSCNNLKHRSWGRALTAFNRFLQPQYADGWGKPRGGNPSTLPSPRLISSKLLPDIKENDKRSTLAIMALGQLIDHDMTLTAIESSPNGPIKCCNGENDPACFKIEIPKDDKFFKPLNQTCMEFVRAANAPTCPVSAQRQQLNQISSYIDCNFVYGSSLEDWKILRSFSGGRLKTSIVDNREFLLFQNGSCAIKKPTQLKCFRAGDVRANEVSTLTTMQAVFLKEHNRVANYLSQINNDWNDETLFQEARRIVIAELQHIIIYEFLPQLIGLKTMIKYGLILPDLPYLPSISSGVRSEFSAAAYRLHTLIPNFIERRKYDNTLSDSLLLSDQFNDPSKLYENGSYEAFIYGLTGQACQQGDNWFADQLKDHLFQQKGSLFGLDLAAINIQRGRDFGIPCYNDVRQKLCGLKRVTFADYESGSIDGKKIIDQAAARRIETVYGSVDDMDLFVGGFFETPLSGALVGDTMACIIGKQFQRTIRGDRFWYENKGLPSSFTKKELIEIRKTSLARIFCDNSDVKNMQPLALRLVTKGNPKVECSKIPRMNLNKWKGIKTQAC